MAWGLDRGGRCAAGGKGFHTGNHLNSDAGPAVMGTALVHIMSAEQMMAENHTRAQQAFYLADAGTKGPGYD